MIELQNVKKIFGKQVAVDIDGLQIEKGQIYGLIGPNGAGKSTVMKMICGLLQANQGSIRLNGQVLTDGNREQLLKNIGVLIEAPAYYDNLTGYENLQIVQELKGLAKSEVEKVLHLVHLETARNKKVKHYSLGMKQRLGIAMAVMGQPDLIILDEPTNGLDPQAREEMRQLIRRLPQSFQTTVMISSHALDEIEKMVTQIGIIGKGKLLYQGSVEEFKGRYSSKILIETANDDLAREILGLGHQAELTEQGVLLPYVEKSQVAAWIVRLVEAKLPIYRVATHDKSLEEVFLEFTAGKQL